MLKLNSYQPITMKMFGPLECFWLSFAVPTVIRTSLLVWGFLTNRSPHGEIAVCLLFLWRTYSMEFTSSTQILINLSLKFGNHGAVNDHFGDTCGLPFQWHWNWTLLKNGSVGSGQLNNRHVTFQYFLYF